MYVWQHPAHMRSSVPCTTQYGITSRGTSVYVWQHPAPMRSSVPCATETATSIEEPRYSSGNIQSPCLLQNHVLLMATSRGPRYTSGNIQPPCPLQNHVLLMATKYWNLGTRLATSSPHALFRTICFWWLQVVEPRYTSGNIQPPCPLRNHVLYYWMALKQLELERHMYCMSIPSDLTALL